MYNRRVGLLATAIALLAGTASEAQSGMILKHSLENAYRRTPIKGKPSGVARAKRISRKRKNIRARSKK